MKFALLKYCFAAAACSGVLLTSSLLAARQRTILRSGEPEVTVFTGMSDASAAAAIDDQRVIVADDEDNILRIYSRDGGQPLAQRDVSAFIGNTGKKKGKEADLEAAAQIGRRTFWITSHGRDSKGKEVRERQRLFATEVRAEGDSVEIVPLGAPYVHLLDDLIADERLARYRLQEAAQLPPQSEGALNIEGLAETPDGHLLIGFRNPVPKGMALIVPLLNPNDVIEGKRAQLGVPMELDLRGLGVRSIGFHDGRWLIVAGAYTSGGESRLFEWNGTDAPRLVDGMSLGAMNPEAMAFSRADGAKELLMFSDDGTLTLNGVELKKLKDPAQKYFRGAVLPF